MNLCSKMNPEITWTENKNCYMMLGNVNWCCISTTKRIYYCECSILSQRFAAKSAVVVAVVGQASRPKIWHQRVWNSIWVLEQCLISGTLEQQWLDFGHKSVTVSDFRNSTILKHYHQWIYMLSLIHIWRCRRSYACRSRWSPYH